MMQRDRASASLGMVVERADVGHAVVTMPLRDDMMNGHDVTHGGFVFAVADTPFAIGGHDDVAATRGAGVRGTTARGCSTSRCAPSTSTGTTPPRWARSPPGWGSRSRRSTT